MTAISKLILLLCASEYNKYHEFWSGHSNLKSIKTINNTNFLTFYLKRSKSSEINIYLFCNSLLPNESHHVRGGEINHYNWREVNHYIGKGNKSLSPAISINVSYDLKLDSKQDKKSGWLFPFYSLSIFLLKWYLNFKGRKNVYFILSDDKILLMFMQVLIIRLPRGAGSRSQILTFQTVPKPQIKVTRVITAESVWYLNTFFT
jgi:hypothetical protein